jgi:hypothetical protein
MLLASSIDGGFGQIIEQLVGFAIEHTIALLNGGLSNGLSQMTFPGAVAGLAVAFPFVERFSGLGLGLTVIAGFAASDPVVTPFSLAGFAGGRRPQAPGGRTPIPAAFR